MWLGGTLEEAENQTNQKSRKEGTNRAENSHQGAMIKIRILRFTVIEASSKNSFWGESGGIVCLFLITCVHIK